MKYKFDLVNDKYNVCEKDRKLLFREVEEYEI